MSTTEKPKVKCATCGFLAKHAVFTGRPLPTPTFYEVEEVERQTGHGLFTHVPTAFLGQVVTEPVCFARKINIPVLMTQEIRRLEEQQQKIDTVNGALNIMHAERTCDWWYAYQPGLSPKEHLEIRNMERLEGLRQQFSEDREKDRRVYEQGLEAQRTRNDKWMKRFTIVGILLALAQTLVAVIALWLALKQTPPAG